NPLENSTEGGISPANAVDASNSPPSPAVRPSLREKSRHEVLNPLILTPSDATTCNPAEAAADPHLGRVNTATRVARQSAYLESSEHPGQLDTTRWREPAFADLPRLMGQRNPAAPIAECRATDRRCNRKLGVSGTSRAAAQAALSQKASLSQERQEVSHS